MAPPGWIVPCAHSCRNLMFGLFAPDRTPLHPPARPQSDRGQVGPGRRAQRGKGQARQWAAV
eukprot:11188996-Lingulodinium_polyedra.AAC.1